MNKKVVFLFSMHFNQSKVFVTDKQEINIYIYIYIYIYIAIKQREAFTVMTKYVLFLLLHAKQIVAQ